MLGAAVIGLCWWQWPSVHWNWGENGDNETYHAVLLSNGEAYYGQIQQQGVRFLRLINVYYLKAVRGQDETRPALQLRKRGSEWHGPDYMDISLNQVVFIEPVGPESDIGKGIRSLGANSPGQPAKTAKSQ